MRLTCSIGVAVYPTDGSDRSALIDAADQAMYAAKSLGRNQAVSAADPASITPGDETAERSRDALALAGAIEALAMLVDVRDDYTGAHAADVSRLAHAVGLELELGAGAAQAISVAARLHDVGKVAVPDAILRKRGELTEEEWTTMRTHPVVGAEVVGLIPALRPIAPIVRAHHERMDGQGYPDGIRGEDIPLGARVVAVADAYSAMTSDRPYRMALPADAALKELWINSGTQFDPAILDAFESILAQQATGPRTAA